MRDYPYLEINGEKLSLVYPYTLNDRLITEFNVDCSNLPIDFDINSSSLVRYHRTEIRISNDNNKTFCWALTDDMMMVYRRECAIIWERFRATNPEDARVYESDFRDFGIHGYERCFDAWIRDCREQDRELNNFVIYSSYDRLKSTLIHQGRGDAYNRDSSMHFINRSEMVTNPFSNSNTVRDQRSRMNLLDWDNLSENRVKLIHPYNYVPEYKKWYANGEDPITTLLLGAEIEVDEGGETDETAEAVLQIIHGGELKEDKMFAVHDGSLNKGIEFVTMPCSLEYHKTLPYRDIFKYLDEHGYLGHDSAKAGLHIHINRDFFKKIYRNSKYEQVGYCYDCFNGAKVKLPNGTDIQSVKVYDHSEEVPNEISENGYYIIEDNILVLPTGYKNSGKTYTVQYVKNVECVSIEQDDEKECIGKLMYIIEKFEDEMSAISRRDCRYSKLLGYNGEKCKELYSKGYKVRDKYAAVNILHQDTIEIRIFKSTLKYETFMNTLEFVSRLAYFVKDHSEEEIENMTWNDLFETFSDNLKSYYLQRKEIEVKKIQKVYFNGQEVNQIESFSATTSSVYIDESNYARAIENLNHCREASFSMENLNLSSLAELWNNVTALSQPTGIDQIKKEIKDIKQKMKRTKNYMEKRNLQENLEDANKRLKKAKLKEKKENETN